LHYVDDRSPGIRRERTRSGFRYLDARGHAIADERQLARIRSLAVPPAYEDVWICPSPLGHLQATGRDARGRKQYRYHKRWRVVRDKAKYEHSISFARALPALRRRIAKDLAGAGLTREKVLATIARLLDTTLVRIGNEAYARENESFGLTTLRAKHVRQSKSGLKLRFRGKSGIEHSVDVTDRRLAAIIRRCRDLPGQELFAYEDGDGNAVPVVSDDLNAYLRNAMDGDFTAKDFRTWHGSVLCALELAGSGEAVTATERRTATVAAIAAVAGRLRNTPAVCRTCYVHPAIVARFARDGRLLLPELRAGRSPARGLSRDEARVLLVLERHARREQRRGGRPGGAADAAA
jgi:DNA topoisomerase-1